MQLLTVLTRAPQVRLCDITGLEVADRRGYLTMELEAGKDGVLLLRWDVRHACWPFLFESLWVCFLCSWFASYKHLNMFALS